METAQLMLDVLGPVVAIVAIGALVGPRLGIDTASLSRLSYWILGPAFVFNVFATTTLQAETAVKLVLAGAASVTAGALGALFLGPGFGLRGHAVSATVMTSAYGNVGNAGLAISVFALGDDALDRAGVLMVTIMFLGTLLSVWLGTRQSQSAAKAARDALVSPMILAAIIGFVLNVASVDPPTAIHRAVSTVAQGLIPTMLLTLGLQLATTGHLRLLRSTGVVVISKLVIAPLVALGVAVLLGLEGDDRGVVILQSAMPPAVFCMVMALELDLEAERTTNDVALATVASLVTLPVALAIVA